MNDAMGRRPANVWKVVFWAAAAGLGLLLLLGLANYLLNPLTFQKSALREVAKTLVGGSNFALDDPNIDFRGLRREHIRLMDKAPEVVLFAGSRFEVATANTFPGRTFYNAFAHNDYVEDLFAISGLLEETGRLPRTLVLSVRHLSFRPVRDRETDEWRMFEGEYARMAQALGLPVASLAERLPINHYLSMFSMEYLRHGLSTLRHQGATPYGPTRVASADDRDILHADGSITFSRQHIGSFSTESARAESLERARKLGKRKAAQPAEADLQALEKLLRHLQSRGVQTVIAITPHHPTFWEAVASQDYGRSLSQLEATTQALARRSGTVFVGSFNPVTAGCQESSFRDYIHLDEVCLKTIFDRIPKPGEAAKPGDASAPAQASKPAPA